MDQHKIWKLTQGHPPEGPTMFRNPPERTFKPPQEMDAPAFAHNGRGDVIEGQWVKGKHGEWVYTTPHGEFRHGIDAMASHLGNFLDTHGVKVDPKELIDKSINDFSETHTNKDHHGAPSFNNLAWRKIRAGVLPPGTSSRESTNRPSRTKNRTLITTLTNKNAEETPMGRFIESYYNPMHQQLFHNLEDLGFDARTIKQGLPFAKYPYIYANMTTPQGWIHSYSKQHPGEVSADMMQNAPDDYFPGQEKGVHTWEVAHHLPDVFFYPSKGENKQIMSGGGAPTKLISAAHAMVDQAMEGGIEHIPNTPVTINRGTIANPEMIQRPMHEVLQDPELKDALIKDMAHVPAMMFLFGRSKQGNFKKLYDHMMEKYGATEDALSFDQQSKYLAGGEKGGQGMHRNAARVLSLARTSGEGKEEGSSKMREHGIGMDDLKAANLPYSEARLGHVDRYRSIIEALADQQSMARGHEVKRGIGDIPDTPMQGINIHGYPEAHPETGLPQEYTLDPHMDAYLHGPEDYAPNEAMPTSMGEPAPKGVDVPDHMTATVPPVEGGTHVSETGSLSPPHEHAPPTGGAPTPLPQAFQDTRHHISDYNPAEYREMMHYAGLGRNTPAPSPELTPVEARAQHGLADPQQQLLTQYMKAEDNHLPVIERIMKALEAMQLHEAELDSNISKHIRQGLNNTRRLAEYTGLTNDEVNTINHTMGDWYNIAKSYRIEPKYIKVIKMNLR